MNSAHLIFWTIGTGRSAFMAVIARRPIRRGSFRSTDFHLDVGLAYLKDRNVHEDEDGVERLHLIRQHRDAAPQAAVHLQRLHHPHRRLLVVERPEEGHRQEHDDDSEKIANVLHKLSLKVIGFTYAIKITTGTDKKPCKARNSLSKPPYFVSSSEFRYDIESLREKERSDCTSLKDISELRDKEAVKKNWRCREMDFFCKNWEF